MRRRSQAPSAVSAARRGTTPARKTLFGLVCVCALGLAAFLGSGAPSAGADPACGNEALRAEQHSTFLPDCRAYEMVSPVDKNGGDIAAYSPRTRSSQDGNAASFSSLVGFGDPHGTGVSVEYLAERDAALGKWVTHAITPTVEASSANVRAANADTLYEGSFSPDFQRGVLLSVKPVTDDPDVKDVLNLYRRDDLRTPGNGSYELLSTCPTCGETPLKPVSGIPSIMAKFIPRLAGSSPDLEHVAFDSVQNLTADAPAQAPLCGSETVFFPSGGSFCASRLYEWDHGELRLASVLPDGSPADSAFAGTGALNTTYTPHVVSDGSDGHSRIFFTQPTDETGKTFSELGLIEQLLLMLGAQTGNLFMRVDHEATAQLNASERTDCAENDPCTGTPEPDTFAQARYLDASTDGQRIFFSTFQALTDDAPVDNSRKVYMYDASKPATDAHNLTLLNPPGTGATPFLGASDDGRYAYMVVNGNTLALWHDGTWQELGKSPQVLPESALGTDGGNWSQALRETRVTPDGRFLLFPSERPPVDPGYDHGKCDLFGCTEIYVYDADADEFSCASCNPTGAPATTSATILGEGIRGATLASTYQHHAISDDGSYVFFNTEEALVPEDTNGFVDAYQYDVRSGKVSLLSSGTDHADSFFVESSPSGRDVFIATRQRLAGWDTDGSYDLYDVRVEGGLPEPVPVPAACKGEACHAGAPASPAATDPGSSTLRGAGNPKPHPARCAKNRRQVRRNGKVRCVKKHSKRHAKHDRRASR